MEESLQKSGMRLQSSAWSQSQTPQTQEVSTGYRVNRNTTGRQIKKQKLFKILKWQILFVIAAIIIYMLALPVKYLISNTDANRKINDCEINLIKWNGWSFQAVCSRCKPNFTLSPPNLCLPLEN